MVKKQAPKNESLTQRPGFLTEPAQKQPDSPPAVGTPETSNSELIRAAYKELKEQGKETTKPKEITTYILQRWSRKVEGAQVSAVLKKDGIRQTTTSTTPPVNKEELVLGKFFTVKQIAERFGGIGKLLEAIEEARSVVDAAGEVGGVEALERYAKLVQQMGG